jgi:pseudouridine-5'-phosphate glycosidase
VRGPAFTPFMLQHMAEHSQGATVRVNCALAVANARLAAELAALAARARPGEVESP